MGIKDADLSDLIPTTEVLDDVSSRMVTGDSRSATTTPSYPDTTVTTSTSAVNKLNSYLLCIISFLIVFTGRFLNIQN